MRTIKHLGWCAAENATRAACWMQSPKVFPWFVFVVGMVCTAAMIAAYIQQERLWC